MEGELVAEAEERGRQLAGLGPRHQAFHARRHRAGTDLVVAQPVAESLRGGERPVRAPNDAGFRRSLFRECHPQITVEAGFLDEGGLGALGHLDLMVEAFELGLQSSDRVVLAVRDCKARHVRRQKPVCHAGEQICLAGFCMSIGPR